MVFRGTERKKDVFSLIDPVLFRIGKFVSNPIEKFQDYRYHVFYVRLFSIVALISMGFNIFMYLIHNLKEYFFIYVISNFINVENSFMKLCCKEIYGSPRDYIELYVMNFNAYVYFGSIALCFIVYLFVSAIVVIFRPNVIRDFLKMTIDCRAHSGKDVYDRYIYLMVLIFNPLFFLSILVAGYIFVIILLPKIMFNLAGISDLCAIFVSPLFASYAATRVMETIFYIVIIFSPTLQEEYLIINDGDVNK